MKFNKIISSLLVLVMLATSFSVVIPVSAAEAEAAKPQISIQDFNSCITEDNAIDDVKQICKNYKEYDFDTAAEMLAYEMNLGYLDSLVLGDYAIYLNRYTGLMYYVNNVTGQILTSNPIDSAYKTKDGATNKTTMTDAVMSQIELGYFKITDGKIYNYDSLKWIQDGSHPIVTKYTDSSIAIQYFLGSNAKFVAPKAILYSTAKEKILLPVFENVISMMEESCGEFDQDFADSKYLNITSYNVLDHDVYRTNSTELLDLTQTEQVFTTIAKYAREKLGKDNPKYITINEYISQLKVVLNSYNVITAEQAVGKTYVDKVGAFANGETVFMLAKETQNTTSDALLPEYRKIQNSFKVILPSYTADEVESQEIECGYGSASVDAPFFTCTIVYSIAEDGSLIVDLPANLIDYDESMYAISSITPLKYFGAADMGRDGYLFYPDGSGMVLDFDKFYFGEDSELTNITINITSQIYGKDYCYSTIIGAHREQVSMPVYGIVTEVDANNLGASSGANTVNNGYFAIIEDGESLIKLGSSSGGGTHKYISAYAMYTPIPNDTYDLSQSISVSGLGSYTVVSAASHNGSLKTRYVMLTDESVAKNASLDTAYVSDYVGMANYYRDYLERNGVITELEDVYEDLPLYIEALGSISITKKVLSFPVTTSVPLTTFEDVVKIYTELSGAKQKLLDKAAEYTKAADELEAEDAVKHAAAIADNRATAQKYTELSAKITDIKNINFRLTGFTNGGMHFTYPAKVSWESAVGGKSGFNSLLDSASDVNKNEDANFGVYPDFDFMYINNTAAFDAISTSQIAACKVDNRYASKQTYSSVTQKFESTFALLVSASSLDSLYTKFLKQYSAYDVDGISVSTLGSDLNSNFDQENPIVRQESIPYIQSLLEKMSANYSVMSDVGNAYTLKYLDHILNASIDSSHLNNSSYAIPFYGMVLHGYVNYTGTPINYSGSPKYDILRSIENGASLYYVLCTQNTSHLKEDSLLSKYYGVDYYNWYDQIVEQYDILNDAIGSLQQHKIVDHSIIYAERIIDEEEMNANYLNLIDEFVANLDEIVSAKIDDTIKEMQGDASMLGKGVKFAVSNADFAGIIANISARLNLDEAELESEFNISALINSVLSKYVNAYNKDGGVDVTVTSDDISYKSKYKYVTDSIGTDDNYAKTDFTCDNGNVIMVKYEKEVDGVKDTVVFLLNYNIFSVKIKVDTTVHSNVAEFCDEDGYITLDPYGFVKIQ